MRLAGVFGKANVGMSNDKPGEKPGRRKTNPTRNDLASETLDLRRTRFSRVCSLLMSAFALPIPPAVFTNHLQAFGTLSYHLHKM